MNNSSKSSAKFAAYILGKLLAVLLSVLVIVLAFLIAMNTMNIRVTVKDAFTIRDSVMLIQTDNDNKELVDKVFSSNYIEKSGILNLSDNKAYNVTNYNQDTDVTFKLIWPWQTKATVTVSDVVDDVRATLVSDTVDESQLKENYLIESGKYNVNLVKTKKSFWRLLSRKLHFRCRLPQSLTTIIALTNPPRDKPTRPKPGKTNES